MQYLIICTARLIQILQWKTDTTASWTPDTSQSVYKGGTHE